MDKLKERWEFIVGYVALIVSLSAFKDELTHINLNMGFLTTTGAHFLFLLILSFIFTMHLYLIPFLLSSTRYANIRLIKVLESLSYYVFVLLAISPIFMMVSVAVTAFVNYLTSVPTETREIVARVAFYLVFSVYVFLSITIAFRALKRRYSAMRQELENQEIKEFENAQKLYDDAYYSQSILEAFKVMELHLRRLIAQRDIPFRSAKFQDVLDVAFKLNLINKSEKTTINRLRQMRNSAAHLDINFTKAEANEAIDFLRSLIMKTSTNENSSAA